MKKGGKKQPIAGLPQTRRRRRHGLPSRAPPGRSGDSGGIRLGKGATALGAVATRHEYERRDEEGAMRLAERLAGWRRRQGDAAQSEARRRLQVCRVRTSSVRVFRLYGACGSGSPREIRSGVYFFLVFYFLFW